ncbi:MAG TPA: response regulator [Phycisphaerae bacterium]|jgi:two-component system OmpR family response regulator|nr:response regulator [Phycisphaerae bacterium]HOB73513.1 response regulator [Phycisphaerae bacterium]HPU31880.1 response regulator [Phycisphaerae bacterium]HQA44627.1 response regulator [Phycisphaerae bacterium]
MAMAVQREWQPTMSMGSTRILLVEDDPRHCQFVHDLLSQQGWVVESAADAHEAFVLARQYEPHVLVADWMLPDKITGGVLVALLREFFPHMHVVFITGLPVADLKGQARHLAPCEFIQKPYGAGELIDAVLRAEAGAHANRLAMS